MENSGKEYYATSIYPNPVNELLVISYQLIVDEKREVKIFDVMGKELFHATSNSNQLSIDVSPFKSGIYFVHLLSNNKTALQKLIIQH